MKTKFLNILAGDETGCINLTVGAKSILLKIYFCFKRKIKINKKKI